MLIKRILHFCDPPKEIQIGSSLFALKIAYFQDQQFLTEPEVTTTESHKSGHKSFVFISSIRKGNVRFFVRPSFCFLSRILHSQID